MQAFLGVRLLTSAVKYLLINSINKIYTLRRQTSQHSTVYVLFQYMSGRVVSAYTNSSRRPELYS